jgi:hypothetical protein
MIGVWLAGNNAISGCRPHNIFIYAVLRHVSSGAILISHLPLHRQLENNKTAPSVLYLFVPKLQTHSFVEK